MSLIGSHSPQLELFINEGSVCNTKFRTLGVLLNKHYPAGTFELVDSCKIMTKKEIS